MRNRAKCKLCNEIIESFHRNDFVTCKCGEISIDGGDVYFRCSAKDWKNFLRVDDLGNEIIPTIEEKEDVKPLYIETPKPTRADKIKMLEEMIASYESLSSQGLSSFVTNYDLLSALILVLSILQEN